MKYLLIKVGLKAHNFSRTVFNSLLLSTPFALFSRNLPKGFCSHAGNKMFSDADSTDIYITRNFPSFNFKYFVNAHFLIRSVWLSFQPYIISNYFLLPLKKSHDSPNYFQGFFEVRVFKQSSLPKREFHNAHIMISSK